MILMSLAGEFLQALHWLLPMLFAYCFGWKGYIAYMLISVLGIKIWGDCFITIWSNKCFARAGHPGYLNLIYWILRKRRVNNEARGL